MLGATIASLLIVVVSELVLRAWVYTHRDPMERFDRDAGMWRLVPGEYDRGTTRARVNASGLAGPPLREAPVRIALLGDSCTIGEADGVNSYPARLRARLDARGLDVEVLNAGLAGLDAEQLRQRLASVVLPLEPDVVGIYAGWNDLMKRSPRSQSTAFAGHGVSRWLDSLWLVKGARKLLGFHGRRHFPSPVVGPSGDTGRFRAFEPDVFRAELTGMVRDARNAGARVFLMTLPTALHGEMHPYDLEHADATYPYFVGGDRLGDFLALLAAYNEAIRAVGRFEQVPVVDLAAAFDPGRESAGLFFDTMHPSSAGMDRIARLVDEALARADWLAPTPD